MGTGEKSKSKNKIIKHMIEFLIAFIVVGVAMNLALYTYYDLPSKIKVEGKATDTVWNANRRVITAVEGFGHNTTDSNGYNNDEGILENRKYILALGSSNTQAFNVNREENYCTLLSKYLSNANSGVKVYNAGIDGHAFIYVVKHFKAAMEQFPGASSVIIETGNVEFTEDELSDSLLQTEYSSNTITTTDKEDPVRFLQSMPLIRLTYRQTASFNLDLSGAFLYTQSALSSKPKTVSENYTKLLNKVLGTIRIQANKPVIIFYHSHLLLQKDGSVAVQTDNRYLDAFENACKANNICFVDMTDAFIDEYYSNHTLPYGFYNTLIGEGHLNKEGHKTIAERLAETIRKMGV